MRFRAFSFRLKQLLRNVPRDLKCLSHRPALCNQTRQLIGGSKKHTLWQMLNLNSNHQSFRLIHT